MKRVIFEHEPLSPRATTCDRSAASAWRRDRCLHPAPHREIWWTELNKIPRAAGPPRRKER